MIQFFIGDFVGKTNVRLWEVLREEDVQQDVVVWDRNGASRKANIVACSKEFVERLKQREDDPPLHYVLFWRRQEGQRIIEIPPHKRAGTSLASRARALQRQKARRARTPF